MKFTQVHHVAIIASDYEKTIDFYVKKLGFNVLRENHRPEKGDIKLDLQFGDMELELFVVKTAPPRPSYPEALGLRHLAFLVDDVEAVAAHMRDCGFAPEPLRTDSFDGRKMTFVKDPDGLPIELHE